MNIPFQTIFNWAKNEYGLVISSHQKHRVENALIDYLEKEDRNPNTFIERFENKDAKTINNLIDILTVPESYFFRDQSCFLFLQKHYFPNLIKRKRKANDLRLNIWSAGCAAGEELYSVAMLLLELIPDPQHWKLNLVGTDISYLQLAKAREGLFTKLALRAIDEKRKHQYFTKINNRYQLKKTILEMADFFYANLQKEPPLLNLDLILCRNVFIYFSEQDVQKILGYFYQALKEDGIAILGASDFIQYLHHDFKLNADYLFNYLSKPAKKPAAIEKPAKTIKAQSLTRKLQENSATLNAIAILLRQKKWHDALHKINAFMKTSPKHALLYRYQGEALIGIGDTDTAENAFLKAIQLNPKDEKTHYFLALLQMESNKNQAREGLLKALDLKRSFPEAHYHLAMLYLSQEKEKEGINHLQEAKAAALSKGLNEPILGSKECMSSLVQNIDLELSQYQEKGNEW